MLPLNPTLLISVALAWVLSLALAAGVTEHYTGKFYKGKIDTLIAKGDANAAEANRIARTKEVVAASLVGEAGVKAQLELAQGASREAALLGALGDRDNMVHSLTESYWLLAGDLTKAREAGASAASALPTGLSSALASLAQCDRDRGELTRTSGINNEALRACSVQVRGLVSSYEGVRITNNQEGVE